MLVTIGTKRLKVSTVTPSQVTFLLNKLFLNPLFSNQLAVFLILFYASIFEIPSLLNTSSLKKGAPFR